MMKHRNKTYCFFYGVAILLCNFALGNITAPTACQSGELAVVESDTPATWTVYPEEYRASYCIAENGTKCFFASPQKGAITFIAASVDTSKDNAPVAVIHTHTLYYGVPAPNIDNSGDVEPVPEPTPEPEPDTSIEGTIKTEVEKINSDKRGEEITALSDSFASVIDGINRGVIKTPEGARATFRSMWTINAAKLSNTTLNTYKDLITAISAKVDNTSIQTIHSDYERVVNALAPYKETPKQTPPQTPTSGNNACPNGSCNINQTNQFGGYRCRQ